MFVIRLPNGNLKVPQSAIGHDGRVIGDVYVEIGPQDADYSRLAAQALTAEEVERRRDRWRQEDEALRQEFLEFARRNSESPWSDSADGEGALCKTGSRVQAFWACASGRCRSHGQQRRGKGRWVGGSCITRTFA